MLIQYGVVPVRSRPGGVVEVMLITSRDTRRWVVPRGNPLPGKSGAESAAQEAYEEAGITGPVGAEAIGSYPYAKRRRFGRDVPALVHLFRMEVEAEGAEWPEKSERERRWFSVREAAAAVAEPELAELMLSLDPGSPEDARARARRAIEALDEPALVVRDGRVGIGNAGARVAFGSGIEGRELPDALVEAVAARPPENRWRIVPLGDGAELLCLTDRADAAEALAAALSMDPRSR